MQALGKWRYYHVVNQPYRLTNLAQCFIFILPGKRHIYLLHKFYDVASNLTATGSRVVLYLFCFIYLFYLFIYLLGGLVFYFPPLPL